MLQVPSPGLRDRILRHQSHTRVLTVLSLGHQAARDGPRLGNQRLHATHAPESANKDLDSGQHLHAQLRLKVDTWYAVQCYVSSLAEDHAMRRESELLARK